MATEREFELLDDYLSNRMDAAERSAFERKLQADPDLRNEYSFQQSVVSGIRRARAAELKSMLQNTPVPVPAKGTTSTGGKVIVGSLVAAIVATGIYLYLREPQAEPGQTPEAVEQPMGQPAGTVEETTTDETTTPDASLEENEIVPDQKDAAGDKPQAQKVPEKVDVNVFDPTQEDETEGAPPSDESPRTADGAGGASMPVRVEKQNRDFGFHYQFRDDELYLYGPFETDLYEILEIFGEDGKRTLFLYFNESYYLLDQRGTKVKPLTPITDPQLLAKLKEYRAR